MNIDPWGSSQFQDYARLRDQFGIEAFGPEEWGIFAEPHRLFRRGVVFGHRDFQRVMDAVRDKDPWSVMTGFMPSGPVHFGHKMLFDQVIAHQHAGADIHLALADFEAMAARGLTREGAHKIAREEYVHHALALGLQPERAQFYFQTQRRRVQDMAQRFARRVNWSTLQALYGFSGETSIAHVLAPLVQASDILHVQDDEQGPRPVLVPVGVDQDPHVRLTRDIAQAWRIYNVRFEKDRVGIYVKVDTDVAVHLDRAASVLRDLGHADTKRNDAYKAIHVVGGRPRDVRRIDLALARAEGEGGDVPALLRPSATFHRFMTGLQGGKMSSSRPESGIFLGDAPADAEKKLRSAVTGGKATAEEQRRLGAEPEKCPVYEMYLYHLAKDDAHLEEVYATCKSGARLCGGCKKEAVELLHDRLVEHKGRLDETAHLVDTVIRAD